MHRPVSDKLSAYVRLFGLHQGEARAAYNAVTTVYDGFASLWDRRIAAPPLEYYNLLIRQHVKPGALVLDAGRAPASAHGRSCRAASGYDRWVGRIGRHVVRCQVPNR